jgi:hypothetical protein
VLITVQRQYFPFGTSFSNIRTETEIGRFILAQKQKPQGIQYLKPADYEREQQKGTVLL